MTDNVDNLLRLALHARDRLERPRYVVQMPELLFPGAQRPLAVQYRHPEGPMRDWRHGGIEYGPVD